MHAGLWEVIANHAYFSRLCRSFTFRFFNISMAKSTVQFLREPKRSPQYSWSLIGFFLFLFKHMGILPHLSPVTNANSCNDILIGFPPKRNQISYFFLTLSLRTITYWPKLPENDGFSSRAINFPNGELRRNLTSSGSRASRMDSILLGLWYVLFLQQVLHQVRRFSRVGSIQSSEKIKIGLVPLTYIIKIQPICTIKNTMELPWSIMKGFLHYPPGDSVWGSKTAAFMFYICSFYVLRN